MRNHRVAPLAIISSDSATSRFRVAGPGRPYFDRIAWMSRHCAISMRIIPERVGSPRLGCPFTGACDGSIRSGVGRTRQVAAGRAVRASVGAGAGLYPMTSIVAIGASVVRRAGDAIARGCAANSSATATAEAITVTEKAAMTARRSVLLTLRWCDADWGLWLGKRDDRDLVSDDAERSTGGTGLGDRRRSGRLCGCQ